MSAQTASCLFGHWPHASPLQQGGVLHQETIQRLEADCQLQEVVVSSFEVRESCMFSSCTFGPCCCSLDKRQSAAASCSQTVCHSYQRVASAPLMSLVCHLGTSAASSALSLHGICMAVSSR